MITDPFICGMFFGGLIVMLLMGLCEDAQLRKAREEQARAARRARVADIVKRAEESRARRFQ